MLRQLLLDDWILIIFNKEIMKNIQLILITLLITLCFACSEDDSSTPETQNDNFYALTVGNSWEYRWYNYFSQAPDPKNGKFLNWVCRDTMDFLYLKKEENRLDLNPH